MSELKSLLAEARSSLQDLECLLQKARSLDKRADGEYPNGSEEIRRYAEEILRVMQRMPTTSPSEGSHRRDEDIEQLYQEMEEVRFRVEESIEKLESACEQNVTQLSDFIGEVHRQFGNVNPDGQATPPLSQLNEVLQRGDNPPQGREDIESMDKTLQVAPESLEAVPCLEEAQRKLEDQRLEEELVIHIDNLKQEATSLFDQDKYRECVNLFRFLCELEPKNRTLHDYLELSQQKVQELEESEAQGGTSKPELDAKSNGEVFPEHGQTIRAESGDLLQEPPCGQAASSANNIATWAQLSAERVGVAEPPDDESDLLPSRSYLGVVFGVLAILAGVLLGALLIRNRLGEHGSPDVQSAPPVSTNIPGLDVALLPQANVDSVQLEQLQRAAASLFDQGQFLEANRLCDQVLAGTPQEPSSLQLKTRIRNHFWQSAQNAKKRGRLIEMRQALVNLLAVVPGDRDAEREVKVLPSSLGKKDPPLQTPAPAEGANLTELRRQIAAALSSGNFFPPTSGNAWSLVKRLGEVSPNDMTIKESRDQIHREAVAQLRQKVQSHDAEGITSLGRQLEEYFPASPELRKLRENWKAEESRRLELRAELAQKLAAALARGRYVTPKSDNALVQWNRLLALDPQNENLQAQKHDILTRAVAQAKDLAQNEKFEEARDVLSAVQTAAQGESRGSVVVEAKAVLDRLEFEAFPVVHDHMLGSCTGRLRMNGYIVTYDPSGDSKDGFSERLKEITELEPGDKLKLQLKGKTYRFQPNLVKGKEESRQQVQEIYRTLRGMMEKGKS